MGALQTVLARRVAIAAWRLARADRIEIESFEERRTRKRRARARVDQGRQRPALFREIAALSRRGHGRVLPRAAHAQGAPGRAGALEDGTALAAHPIRPVPRPRLADCAQPNEPERGADPRLDYLPSEPSAGALHEPVVPSLPNEPEPRQHAACGLGARVPDEPQGAPELDPSATSPSPRLTAIRTNPRPVGVRTGAARSR